MTRLKAIIFMLSMLLVTTGAMAQWDENTGSGSSRSTGTQNRRGNQNRNGNQNRSNNQNRSGNQNRSNNQNRSGNQNRSSNQSRSGNQNRSGSQAGTSRQNTQQNKQRIIDNLVSNMVYVEGGTFTMGATSEQSSDAADDEKPAHQVTVSSFSIGKYEVTQEEWEAVMGKNPSNFKGAKRPVEQVSWNDCQEFIRKLNSLTGKQFRLPTEAEWEFAARGGNKSNHYKYAGSNTLGAVAWYDDNSGSTTHPVGQKSPNELGLYDMSGNVYEWCQDWYDSNYYKNSPSSNPCNTATASGRVDRGGSWDSYARYCRVSNRDYWYPDSRNDYLGLRLAL